MNALTEIKMPQSLIIERSILGSFLIYHEIFLKYSHLIQPEYFYNSAFKTIFNYMLLSNCTNAIILKEKFPAFDADITDLINSHDSATDYMAEIDILRDRFERRKLIEISHLSMMAAQEDFERSSTEIIDNTISQINDNHITSGIPEHIRDILPRVIDKLERQTTDSTQATATGLIDVDAVMGCFEPAEFSIIAARPSMGKTSFVCHVIRNIAIRQKLPVLFFSLEMAKEQIAGRILFAESDASYGGALVGCKDDLSKIKTNIEAVQSAGIFLDDTTCCTMSNIYTKTENYVKHHGIKIVFIDHLLFIKSSAHARSKHEEISEISKAMVNMARKLKIPVVLVCQLSREVERRNSLIPKLSDLRESGSLEEDARKVILLYRDDQANRDSMRKGLMDVIVAKNHNGKTGSVEVVFQIDKMIFKNKAKPEDDYENIRRD